MGPVTPFIPYIVAAVATGASIATSQQAASEQRRTQKKQAALQRAAAAYQNAKAAREAVAQAQVKRAQALAIGEAQGVQDSSSVAGAAGSPIGQTAGNIGASQVNQAAAYGIDTLSYRSAQAQAKFSSWNDIFQGVSSAALGYAANNGTPPKPAAGNPSTGTPWGANPNSAGPLDLRSGAQRFSDFYSQESAMFSGLRIGRY